MEILYFIDHVFYQQEICIACQVICGCFQGFCDVGGHLDGGFYFVPIIAADKGIRDIQMEFSWYGKPEKLGIDLYQIDITMTTSAICKKLISYIANANARKIKGMYSLLAEEIEKEESFT